MFHKKYILKGVYRMKNWKLRTFSPYAIAAVVAIVVFGFAFTACNGDGGDEGAKSVAVTGVELDETSLELEVGKSKTLKATVKPATATDPSVTWESSAPDKAEVDANGKVTAKAEGTATITVTTKDGGKTAECEVTVKTPVPVTGVELDETSLELDVGDEAELTATVSPGTADQDVTWESSDPSVVTVTADPTDSKKATVEVIAESDVPVTITVTTVGKKADGNPDTATCEVTVVSETAVKYDPVTDVDLDQEEIELDVGDEVELTATVLPLTADQDVTWESSDPGVATVIDGIVTGVSEGTATITVTTVGEDADGDPVTATCEVIVNMPEIPGMKWIKAGTFTMGSPGTSNPPAETGRQTNETQHEVELTKGFYMGIYPVTQAEYQAVTGNNPSNFKTSSGGDNPANRPVEKVTWYDAVEYCNKLSEQEGLTPVYTITGRTPAATAATPYPITSATVTADWDADGYRLPTEAEWEYACRAGTTTAYNTGATVSSADTGWYTSNSSSRTHVVGEKKANDWGLYDMHGNVPEWCWDLYVAEYGTAKQTDPRGASTGTERMLRGGSYYGAATLIRSAARDRATPSKQFNGDGGMFGDDPYLGFRIVRNAPDSTSSDS
jgi:uncharacterized protein YjdB